jgi:hypothetical protein
MERVLLGYASASSGRYANFDLMFPEHEVVAGPGDAGYERAEEEDQLGEGGNGLGVETEDDASSSGEGYPDSIRAESVDTVRPFGAPWTPSVVSENTPYAASGRCGTVQGGSRARGPAARRVAKRYKLVADPYDECGLLRGGYTSGLVQAARCNGFSRARTSANEAAVRSWLVREMVSHGVRKTHIHKHVDAMVLNVFRITEDDRRLAWADWWGTRVLGTFRKRGRNVA